MAKYLLSVLLLVWVTCSDANVDTFSFNFDGGDLAANEGSGKQVAPELGSGSLGAVTRPSPTPTKPDLEEGSGDQIPEEQGSGFKPTVNRPTPTSTTQKPFVVNLHTISIDELPTAPPSTTTKAPPKSSSPMLPEFSGSGSGFTTEGTNAPTKFTTTTPKKTPPPTSTSTTTTSTTMSTTPSTTTSTTTTTTPKPTTTPTTTTSTTTMPTTPSTRATTPSTTPATKPTVPSTKASTTPSTVPSSTAKAATPSTTLPTVATPPTYKTVKPVDASTIDPRLIDVIDPGNAAHNDATNLQLQGRNAVKKNFPPGMTAAIIGGALVGLLCAVLLVMFIVYRMRKKDEGSYPLDDSGAKPAYYKYTKAASQEFYA